MRKIAAAALVATLSVTASAGPALAAVDPADEAEKVACGTVGPPACEPLREVLALLAPLEPLLAVAAPALAEVGHLVNELSGFDLAAGVPAAQLEATAGGLLDQLRSLPEPVAGILDATGQREALIGALEELLAGLAALPVPVPGLAPAEPAGAPEPAPAPAEESSSQQGSVGSTSASSAAGFGGSLDAPSRPAPARRTVSTSVPPVPVGRTLDLGSTSLPELRLGWADAPSPVDRALAEQVAEELVRPAASTAAALDALPADDERALAVMTAISALLVAAGLLVNHRRSTRHVILD